MHELLMTLLYDAIYFLAALIAAFLVGYLKQRFGTEKLKKFQSELELKQDLAILAVKFAQQAYDKFQGETRYDHAATWLSSRASFLKLKITDNEIEGLIEAALRSLKDEFGEDWAKAAGEA